ncbi:MAG TPA: septum formation family protein [Candidatus Binatia bacterium]|nr:septum formation family protein [Candidatus Binatia bacterium]
MGGLVARFGIIGAIVVGGFVVRDYLTGAASDLQVGDCFDEPPGMEATVSEVTRHPCTDPHDAEVFFVADYSPSGGPFPGDVALEAFIDANCPAAYTAYLGRDYVTDTEYDYGVYFPLPEGWDAGDHEITCFVVRIDGGQMTQSVRAP